MDPDADARRASRADGARRRVLPRDRGRRVVAQVRSQRGVGAAALLLHDGRAARDDSADQPDPARLAAHARERAADRRDHVPPLHHLSDRAGLGGEAPPRAAPALRGGAVSRGVLALGARVRRADRPRAHALLRVHAAPDGVVARDRRGRAPQPRRRPAAQSRRSDVLGGDGQLRPDPVDLPGRVDAAHGVPVARGDAVDVAVPGGGRLRDRAAAAVRGAQRGEVLGCVRRRDARDHGRVRVPDHVRRRGGVAAQHQLPLVPGDVPVLRDPRVQPAAQPAPEPRRPLLRPRSRDLPRRGARDLRGDGVDAVAARDRRPHPARADRHDGRRARDGDDGRRRGKGAPVGGLARRVGRGRSRARDPLRSPDLEAPLDAARRPLARRLRRRARRGIPRGVPRRVRHARGGAPGADPVRRRSARA